MKKGEFINILGIGITLGGLLLIIAQILQTLLVAYSASYLQETLNETKSVLSILMP